MYWFRTKRCNKKGCTKDMACFYAHSKAMSRRIPKQMRANGLFNYIPEICSEYKETKRCSLGESCYLAHGWLEVIFHPLLYKTKLCKSPYKKGVCKKYGIFCAKAHKWSEMRDLAKIFGEDWKRHYDTRFRDIVCEDNETQITKYGKGRCEVAVLKFDEILKTTTGGSSASTESPAVDSSSECVLTGSTVSSLDITMRDLELNHTQVSDYTVLYRESTPETKAPSTEAVTNSGIAEMFDTWCSPFWSTNSEVTYSGTPATASFSLFSRGVDSISLGENVNSQV